MSKQARLKVLSEIDAITQVHCEFCEHKNANSKKSVCNGCSFGKQLISLGEQLDFITKEERVKVPESKRDVFCPETYVKMKTQGMSQNDIAKHFGIARSTLVIYLKEWNLYEPMKKEPFKVPVKKEKPIEVIGQATETNNSSEVDYKSKYEELLKEHNSLRQSNTQLADRVLELTEQLKSAEESKDILLKDNSVLRNDKEELEKKIAETSNNTKQGLIDLYDQMEEMQKKNVLLGKQLEACKKSHYALEEDNSRLVQENAKLTDQSNVFRQTLRLVL
ncbi:zinc-finger domain-containing protein [Priestia megaterium]|uniref:zinc-finger domain-containing protein n=1 Tax=Priestia megaterium TaxID=1404 RepID=UPI0011460F7B|nr:zinc-finger domain-containing protein [Priestia megaterium]